VSKQNATFNVKDKSQFDMQQLEDAVKKANFAGCELVSGPEMPE
jgi:hypothetical protein